MGFDEELYLHKYPDIAHAIKLGVYPDGLSHYIKYGKAEGRCDYIEPVTKDSKVWTRLAQVAPYHKNREDFSGFNSLMNKIYNLESVHIARYNDGEWTFMLRIEPHYSKFMRDNNHREDEVEKISQNLLQIIKSSPGYLIGIDSTTRAKKGLISPKRKEYTEIIKSVNNIVYGDMFNTATIWFGLDALLDPLKDRHTISVGPAYMADLKMCQHITVAENNCWRDAEKLENTVNEAIEGCLSKHPVIVYSCSLLAKLLVDIFYHKYKDKISQLDIGSCIDPWCGIISRPWHKELMFHYLLKPRSVYSPKKRLVNLYKNPSIVSGYTSAETSGLT